MKKNTRIWLIIIITLATVGICAAAYFLFIKEDKLQYYEPEYDEPEVFHDTEFDVENLIGLWEDGNMEFFRYNEDGTAVSWDAKDDVLEEEGTQYDWDIQHDIFILTAKMQGWKGLIPKMYTMRVLEIDTMVYDDDYGNRYSFSKVEELQLLN